ncbi:MFS transporter [Rhodococcus sp. ACS1]|uniref:MFS transporter n=1 Tax=Rhodococcus sp. ACS1 TaxID=2028570 RepID=UPI0015C998CF|nr:MFS transporter [Rhodococcus sp. ACS1]
MSSSVRITEIVDKVPVSNFQRRAIAICLALAFADGFNVLSIGYAIPSLADSYGVAAADFSIVVMAALIGEILSNLLIAPLADRYGRKRIMGLGIVVFGLAAIPSFFASSIVALAACRFVAGIGIGAAVPNGFALGNEYSPTRLKATTVTVLSSGTAVGGLVVGLIASRLVPLHGGEALLLVAGAIPLVILVATWRWLPESIEYLAKSGHSAKVAAILDEIEVGTTHSADTEYLLPFQPAGARVAALFANGRAAVTVLIWSMMFFALFGSYFVLSWLATILTGNGVEEGTALLATSLATLGGIVGALALGVAMDRSRFGVAAAILGPIATIASVSLLAWNLTVGASSIAVGALCFTLGFGAIGLAAALTSVAAQAYPTSVRATGIGWAFGVSRMGGLVAPALGGALLAANMASSMVLLLSAIPAAIAGILVGWCARTLRRATASGVSAAIEPSRPGDLLSG